MIAHCATDWRQSQLIEATFDQLPYPAFIYDNVATIVAVNQAGQSLLQKSSENLTGRSCAEIFHCRTCDRHCGVLAKFRGRPVSAEHTVHVVTDAGRDHLAFVKLSHLTDNNGMVQGVLAIFTSVIETALQPRQAIVAESQRMCELLDFARRVAARTAATAASSGPGKRTPAAALCPPPPNCPAILFTSSDERLRRLTFVS